MNSNHQLPGSVDQPFPLSVNSWPKNDLLLNALSFPLTANTLWANPSVPSVGFFFSSSLDVTLPKAQSGYFCFFHFVFLLSFGHHFKLISLALHVTTSRGICELHLCVLLSVVTGSFFSVGLPLAELISSSLLLAAGVYIATQPRTKMKGAVGNIEWEWSLRKRMNIFFFFFSILY